MSFFLRLPLSTQTASFQRTTRLAFFNDILGAAHGVGRVHVEYVAGDKPVEQHSERGQVLLHRGRCEFSLQLLHEGGDVEGLNVGELGDT